MRLHIWPLSMLFLFVISELGFSDEKDFLQKYNARKISLTGFRHVALEMATNDNVTRRLELISVWQRQPDRIATVTVVANTPHLNGTAILVIETKAGEDAPTVHIALPGSKTKVKQVAADSLHEGLLGSDFSYWDLTHWISTSNAVCRSHKNPNGGESHASIELSPTNNLYSEAFPWSRVVFRFSPELQLIEGVDYFIEDSQKKEVKEKAISVVGSKQVNSYWVPTEMRCHRAPQFSSTLRLKEIRFDIQGLTDAMFVPENLVEWSVAAAAGRELIDAVGSIQLK